MAMAGVPTPGASRLSAPAWSWVLGLALLGAFPRPSVAWDWQVLSVNGEEADRAARIRFTADGEYSGTSGCNRYRGTAEFRDGVLVVTGPVAATTMACAGDPLTRQDDRLRELFQGRVDVEFDPLRYLLTLSRGETIVVLAPIDDSGPSYPAPHSGRDRPAGEPPYLAASGIAGQLEIRRDKNPQSERLGGVDPGTVLRNAGCEEGGGTRWCQVSLPDGSLSGWARADALEAASADLRAGQGIFDAGGYLPCAQGVGAPMTQCGFGVARAGGGTATVIVTRHDGLRRALFFEDGELVGADTSEADGGHETSVAKEGGLSRIRVNDERYEVPEAVVYGG